MFTMLTINFIYFFFNDTATTEIYTLSLHDALPISRPPPKPNVLKPIDSSATLPVRTMRSAQEILRPYFCLTGHSRRRALSRFVLSGQEFSGANRCWPEFAPPRPSPVR